MYYNAPGDSGKFWTTPPQDYGNYIFAIRAKDEAGAVTPVLDEAFLGGCQQPEPRERPARTRLAPHQRTDPDVSNIYLGTIKTTSCDTPVSILDIPAGVPGFLDHGRRQRLRRRGRRVTATDGISPTSMTPSSGRSTSRPSSGSKVNIPGRTFSLGTHTFTVEVLDNSGFCSRIQVKVNIIQFSLERNLLLVDDFKFDQTDVNNQAGFNNPIGRGQQPTDAEHDAFFLDMLSNLDGFDPSRDVIETSTAGQVPLTRVARYKSIVWDSYGYVDSNEQSGGAYRSSISSSGSVRRIRT